MGLRFFLFAVSFLFAWIVSVLHIPSAISPLWGGGGGDMEVHYAVGPLAIVIGAALRPFAAWIARFFGSWLMMGIGALVVEIIPRFLGLGQGLLSWGFGVVASAGFSAFKTALGVAGVTLPNFSDLLAGLPPSVVWACSAMRVHRVVFILGSILVVKLIRKAAEAVSIATTKAASSSLLTGGK